VDHINLYYRDGSSDKVYQVQVVPDGAKFRVNFQYGRRGSTLQSGTKTNVPVDYLAAKKIFDKLVSEKTSKGYTPGEEGTPYAFTDKEQRQTGVHPQLLNSIESAEMEALIQDDRWCAQEKYDGRRMMIRLSVKCTGGRRIEKEVTGINRLGLSVGIPKCIEDDMLWRTESFLIDGEAVGDHFHAFDLLEWKDADCRKDPYQLRREKLEAVVGWPPDEYSSVGAVPTAFTAQEKADLVDSLRARNAEGVVFKRLDAPYVAGRPASTGNQLKFKFYETASCVVTGINQKRSVALGVYDDGKMREIGNVTIPPNQAIPQAGDIVETRYLYAFPKGSLFQPTYLGKRDDIPREECTADQLKIKPND
jgi:bifunctional non-homologous end joining protein LigD